MLRIHDILGWIRIRGSMPLTNGSGSCYFVIDLQDASKKLFSAYYFLKLRLHHFSKIKSQKESQNSRNQGFSYYFCMMIEGSGSGSKAGSGSIPLTSGSGSGRPKNIWIRIRIRIRIRNTVQSYVMRDILCVRREVLAGPDAWGHPLEHVGHGVGQVSLVQPLRTLLSRFPIITVIKCTSGIVKILYIVSFIYNQVS